MDATRTRLSFTAEWLPVAILLVGTVLVVLLMVRELRVAPRAIANTEHTSSVSPAGVPADAVSVPALMLGGDREIRVGDFADAALAKLGSSAVMSGQTAEQGPLGARDVRSYKLGTTSFIVVLEPFERRGVPRVAAIYLQ